MEWIKNLPLNPNLTYLTFTQYEGKTNAKDHLTNVEFATALITDDNVIIYKMFVGSLQGKAHDYLV